MPCVLKTCSCANVPCLLTYWLPTWLACLRAHVPTCLTYNYVFKCLGCLRANISTALRTHVPICLECLRAYLPACLTCLHPHVPTCLACLCTHMSAWLASHVLMCQHDLGPLPHMPCVTPWSPANKLCLLSKYFWCHFFQFHCHSCWSCTQYW